MKKKQVSKPPKGLRGQFLRWEKWQDLEVEEFLPGHERVEVEVVGKEVRQVTGGDGQWCSKQCTDPDSLDFGLYFRVINPSTFNNHM